MNDCRTLYCASKPRIVYILAVILAATMMLLPVSAASNTGQYPHNYGYKYIVGLPNGYYILSSSKLAIYPCWTSAGEEDYAAGIIAVMTDSNNNPDYVVIRNSGSEVSAVSGSYGSCFVTSSNTVANLSIRRYCYLYESMMYSMNSMAPPADNDTSFTDYIFYMPYDWSNLSDFSYTVNSADIAFKWSYNYGSVSCESTAFLNQYRSLNSSFGAADILGIDDAAANSALDAALSSGSASLTPIQYEVPEQPYNYGYENIAVVGDYTILAHKKIMFFPAFEQKLYGRYSYPCM